ncbi:Starch-binding associating with outer membrane [Polaribacter sp. KT25b]|uniref:SusD/RagB family nutrient-binding outer membrane lipoprotein n=1 Tax=Polaribacter sp. KT25b TaxID=1855336 RepID=UPI000879CF7F|nr:SusD/RagB family nutrient-binding outer membrane lipoprotein [Polaribacter sp. KT25b]SDR73328.1 Starch-binding associating with outer membrane [Polaribacter sp. KT25b]
MKLINKYILTLFVLTSIFSCSDYLDVNTSPNDPTADVVGPELILPAAQNGSYSAKAGTQNRFGLTLMNQWAGDVTNFTGGNVDEYRFNVTATFYGGIWNNAYLASDKLQAVINIDSPENVYFTAIAKVLKAQTMQYVVDIYGDAPYSEAFQRGENYQPAYDAASDIYKSLFIELTEAITLIDGAGLEAVNPGSSDVMLGGDMDMWKKFANTLRLKLLVRASSSSDGDVQSWVSSSWGAVKSLPFLGVGENITTNPGYTNGNGQQNYFWEIYGFSTDGNQTNTNRFIVGSQYFIEYLKASSAVSPVGAFDGRIAAFFNTASGSGGDYQGVIQGADDPVDENIGLSYIGAGLLADPSQDGLYFSAAESLFLQAEAALNGNISGSAQTFFENGISSSFAYYGLDATTYLTGISGISGIGWSASDNLEAIIRQKWTALHGIDGAEIFIEHNRTGFPDAPLPTLATQAHRPYRLLYPTSELNGNTANVPAVAASAIFAPAIFYQK